MHEEKQILLQVATEQYVDEGRVKISEALRYFKDEALVIFF
jgi:hypothetical protein